jgi:hypothetical protein
MKNQCEMLGLFGKMTDFLVSIILIVGSHYGSCSRDYTLLNSAGEAPSREAS